ncbi:AsmA family protein [Pseudodesulfovibrio sp. zrk46]|uniref:AsmA family protein n=1 Tax=Pseudodesulfovibrio sp. zrk46 TaxID=2725288 RepID=UPI0014492072|nr:AsmA family protein [Pseudodesulfovibrio sp. zrk46]QJB57251.1 AsmA family protein [Pseudodesulfovibrio sp. zrk46]
MKRAVKLSIIGLGVAFCVVILAVVVFFSTFDLNNYKDRIAQAVHDETGRTLTFEGDLSLGFFPRLGVSLGGVSLSNANGFKDEFMVRADSARVSVRILPLIFGKIRFGTLELDGLSLNLSRRKDGVANWDDLVGRAPKDEPEKEGRNEQFSLDIEGVTVRSASLAWDDDVADVLFVLRDINLETGRIYKGAPFPMKAELAFECSDPGVQGKLQVTGKSSLDLENREYGHMDMKLSLDAKGDAVPGGVVSGTAAFTFLVMNFNEEHAQLTGFTASAYGMNAHVDGSLEGITDGIRKVVATVSIDPFDARKSLTQLGLDVPDTAEASALTSVKGMADVVYVPGDLELKTFSTIVDGAQASGSMRVKWGAEKGYAFARLDAGTIDLDRYLPPDHADNTTAAKEEAAQGSGERIFNTRLLRRLNLDLEGKVAKLRAEGMWFENVHAKAKAENGMININPLAADLYGGTLSSGITINATGQYPDANLIAGLHKVNIGDLSRDVTGESSYEGILEFNAAVSANGERLPILLRSMNGKLSLQLTDGVFPGVDLAEMAKKTHESKGKKEGTVEAVATDSTKFGTIEGTAVIKSGILRNKDLEVKAPGLRANGEGIVKLPTRELDYLLKVKLVASKEGQGGKSSDDLFGVMVPIRVSGTLEHPRYWVSLTEYVKALGGAVIGTAGSIIGGVTGVIKGVGKAVTGGGGPEKEKQEAEPHKKFLGIF